MGFGSYVADYPTLVFAFLNLIIENWKKIVTSYFSISGGGGGGGGESQCAPLPLYDSLSTILSWVHVLSDLEQMPTVRNLTAKPNCLQCSTCLHLQSPVILLLTLQALLLSAGTGLEH